MRIRFLFAAILACVAFSLDSCGNGGFTCTVFATDRNGVTTTFASDVKVKPEGDGTQSFNDADLACQSQYRSKVPSGSTVFCSCGSPSNSRSPIGPSGG